MALIDMNRLHLPLVISLFIILSSAPIAYAVFLTPVEIIDSAGDGVGNPLDGAVGIATDSWGNVFVSGFSSDNAFKLVVDDVVGATLIPIDTTALLVAGFNANSIWMIPTVLGLAGAGIAIYKLKRK